MKTTGVGGNQPPHISTELKANYKHTNKTYQKQSEHLTNSATAQTIYADHSKQMMKEHSVSITKDPATHAVVQNALQNVKDTFSGK